jgi:hypothetical protein
MNASLLLWAADSLSAIDAYVGIEAVKVEPSPSALRTAIVPPCDSTIALLMYKPIPDPATVSRER